MKIKISTHFALCVVAFFFVCAGGWIANIYKLAMCGVSFSEWGAMEVLRVIGIFLVPLGAVLGFI
jgi:hypothetical protein